MLQSRVFVDFYAWRTLRVALYHLLFPLSLPVAWCDRRCCCRCCCCCCVGVFVLPDSSPSAQVLRWTSGLLKHAVLAVLSRRLSVPFVPEHVAGVLCLYGGELLVGLRVTREVVLEAALLLNTSCAGICFAGTSSAPLIHGVFVAV